LSEVLAGLVAGMLLLATRPWQDVMETVSLCCGILLV
jgi:hypothetical protein